MENNREVRIIDIPRFLDHRGILSVVEEMKEIPFLIKRAYWAYDVPGDASRGGHAHIEQQQVIIAITGSFSVTTDDGSVKQTFLLDNPSQGLYISGGIWNTLDNFSPGAVCMVLASDPYDENDYIRDYDEFLKIQKGIL